MRKLLLGSQFQTSQKRLHTDEMVSHIGSFTLKRVYFQSCTQVHKKKTNCGLFKIKKLDSFSNFFMLRHTIRLKVTISLGLHI